MVARQVWRGISLILALALLAAVPVFAQEVPNDNLKAQRRRIGELYKSGSYVEALALQRALVARTEADEMAGAGKPGPKTADALGNLAWYALIARDFAEALAASERARALAADQVWIESNRAHALLFLGRLQEARQIYLAHKGARLTEQSGKTWEDMIANDFEELRKRGLAHVAFDEIATELGLDKVQPNARSGRSAGRAAWPAMRRSEGRMPLLFGSVHGGDALSVVGTFSASHAAAHSFRLAESIDRAEIIVGTGNFDPSRT